MTEYKKSSQERDMDRDRALELILAGIDICEGLIDSGVKVNKSNFLLNSSEVYIPEGVSNEATEYDFSTGRGDLDTELSLIPGALLVIHLWVPRAESLPADGIIQCRVSDNSDSDTALNIHIMKGKITEAKLTNFKNMNLKSRSTDIPIDQAHHQLKVYITNLVGNLALALNSSYDDRYQRHVLGIIESFIERGVVNEDDLQDEQLAILHSVRELFDVYGAEL